jgi:hypothetical protein
MRSLLALLFALTGPVATLAQGGNGVWSLALNAGYTIPVTSGMRGTATEFQRDVREDYSPSRYPYGDDRALAFSSGGQMAFRLPGSAVSALAGVQRTTFFVDDETGDEARMALWTFMLGIEYSLGTYDEAFNGFGRVGVNSSVIDGNVVYRFFPPFSFTTEITPAVRIGFESELGARYNIAGLPLSVEASVHYAHANLIGMSFEDPGMRPPQTLEEVALNDGANPEDPGDVARSIGFVALRATARVRF